MEANKRIGDYEILDELGSGGMGRVYRVRNVISDRVEAMKVVLPDLVGRQELVARFLREIKVLATLNHPNIAALRTALTLDNQFVMIMEYVDGQSLAARLNDGPIQTSDALTYLDQMLSALSYAHERDVIHRDIKPANMMLTSQGVIKLMDFGIARSGGDQTLLRSTSSGSTTKPVSAGRFTRALDTATGATTGSLSYMSPEQVRGEAADARSDLYSLGVSLYEMVTGQRPFQADTDYAVMVAHLQEAPRPPIVLQPGLSADLNEIILTAIEKDPARRFQSADAFRDALRKAQPVPAQAATASRRATIIDSVVSTALSQGVAGAVSADPISEAAIIDGRTPSDPQVPLPDVWPNPAAQPPPPTFHPSLYMVLGGLLVVGALVGIGLYIERAEAKPGASNETTSAPAPVPVERTVPPAQIPPTAAAEPQSSATGSVETKAAVTLPAVNAVTPPAVNAVTLPAVKAVTPPAVKAVTPSAVKAVTPPGVNAVTPLAVKEVAPARSGRGDTASPQRVAEPEAKPQETAQNPVDFDQLEHEVDQLTARAGAVQSSLDRLQLQQARQGLGLRGDIGARQQRMRVNLLRAQEAVVQRNAARAERFKRLAESEVEALEQFLGR